MAQRLDALPRKNAKYWTDVDADVKIYEEITPEKCKHKFARISGDAVECNKCHIGFFITPDFNIKDGHLYKGKKLVI